MLQIRDLNVYYGKFQALSDITLDVERGQIVAILGANSAGKSTLLNTISGSLKPESGSIYVKGMRIDTLEPYHIVELGVTLVPEGRRVFPSMTIQENLLVGSFTSRDRRRRNETLETIFNLFPRLKDRISQTAASLSGGEQQMLAIGRALMSQPDLVMFDEVSLGLSPLVVKDLYQVIKQINKEGVTVVLVEQDVKRSLKSADFVYILREGRISSKGKPSDFTEEKVKEAYFGFSV